MKTIVLINMCEESNLFVYKVIRFISLHASFIHMKNSEEKNV